MEMIKVKLASPIRKFADGLDEVKLESLPTINDALQALTAKFPALKPSLLNEKGDVRHFVGIYLGENNIKTLQGLKTSIKSGDVVSIVLAVAGG